MNKEGRTHGGVTNVDGGRLETFKRLWQTFCGPTMTKRDGLGCTEQNHSSREMESSKGELRSLLTVKSIRLPNGLKGRG